MHIIIPLTLVGIVILFLLLQERPVIIGKSDLYKGKRVKLFKDTFLPCLDAEHEWSRKKIQKKQELSFLYYENEYAMFTDGKFIYALNKETEILQD